MHFECHTAIYSMEDVYNVDEIGLFFHHEPQETLASKPVKGKKIDKERIIVGLCVNVTGRDKMLPVHVVIGKSKRPRCFGKTFDPNLLLHYYYNTKAWMMGTVFED